MVILDTETTGFSPEKDRVVEVAAIKFDGLNTGDIFHRFFNPWMKMPKAAQAVHGLSDEFLATQGGFAESASALREFIGDHEIIAHNAAFDHGMLDAEFRRANYPPLENKWHCSLTLSKSKGKGPHNLDALCRRYNIDLSQRTHHNAVLDCQLLSKVWVELNGGRQITLEIDLPPEKPVENEVRSPREIPLPSRLSLEELKEFNELCKTSGRKFLWNQLKADSSQ